MKILVISTSPRQNSNSKKLAKLFSLRLESLTGTEVKCLDMEGCDIPMVGRGNLDKANLSAWQSTYINAWAAADVILFTIPEYNFTTGGEYLNALHQLGGKDFAHLFDGKVFALAGVSTGRGGRLPALEINMVLGKVIAFLNQHSIISPKFFESHETAKNINDDGTPVGNPFFDSGVDGFLEYTLKIAGRWL